jgi:preprotein translocase subunit SecG
MTIVLTIIHVIVCFFLVVVVLLQSGKAADLAGAFGGMGSQTAFGPRGSATVLSKATTIAAAVFMVTSLTLAILATRNATSTGSVLERQKALPPKSGPAKPTGTPSVTVTPEGGTPKTMPLQVPGSKPAAGQQAPAKQAPAPTKK